MIKYQNQIWINQNMQWIQNKNLIKMKLNNHYQKKYYLY